VNDPGQIATQFRKMLGEARTEYLEFSRPPYAVDPLDAELVIQRARAGGVPRAGRARNAGCAHQQFLNSYRAAGVEVRQLESLPMKLRCSMGAAV
jgi:hypothetical protein